ncbi:FimD/PapC N-terminal domain-containing protein, partial [Klebsiella pneumoniae]
MVFCSLGKIANVHSLGLFIFVSLSPLVMKVYATDNIQFNTDVLDVRDRKNIDLSQFSRSGYIMPGTYDMVVHINKNTLPEQEIPFYEPDDDP